MFSCRSLKGGIKGARMLLDCLSPFNSYFVAPRLRSVLGSQVFVGAHLL
jgi:hypothetical protein